METKKRPNDDALEIEANETKLVATASMDVVATGATPIDADTTATEVASTAVGTAPRDDCSAPLGEAHKRLKLTMEEDKSSVGYSPSADVPDPSKKTKELVEWVEKMDEDDKVQEASADGTTEQSSLAVVKEPIEHEGPAMDGVNSQQGATDAVARAEPDSRPEDTAESKAVDAPTLATIDPAKNVGQDTAVSDSSSQPNRSDSQPEDVNSLDAGQEPAAVKAGPSAAELSDAIMAVSSLSEPLVTTLETLVSEEAQASSNDAVSELPATSQDKAENGPPPSDERAAVDSAPRLASPPPPSASETTEEVDRPLRMPSAPPADSAPSVPTAPNPSQVKRPSRSSMSVSALLLNNDEDNEQEVDYRRRASRTMMDPYEAPSVDPSPPSPPPMSQNVTYSASHPIAPMRQPSPAHTTSSMIPLSHTVVQPPSSVSPHLHGGIPMAHHAQEPTEAHHLHQMNPRYNQSSGRHDAGGMLLNKEYPADEVMESGGVTGYGAHRHRLASPIGIRPVQESVNGSAGSNPANGKLPGVGSAVGMPPSHLQEFHGHPTAIPYRNERQPSPGPDRQNIYTSNQYASMAHATTTNGQMQYPSAHPSGPGLASSGSMPPVSAVTHHHPRLIVKNDPSLKVDNLPEQFLGYYRYDPTLLLPGMQGKENSLLEVRIASVYLTYDNVKVKKREVWGTDVYTDDSDVVARQQHNFVADPIKHICPSYDLAVTLRVVPKLIKYQGSIRNRIKSRTWSIGHDGVSLKIESIRKLCPGEALNRGRSQSKRRMKEYNQERLRVLSNVHDETTESLQNEKAMRTATFEFTHQGDPCFKYSPELVMDRHDGLSRKWTSWRLKKEVLILENDEERYEISLQHHAGTDARRFDQYRFAVISPRTSLSGWSKANYPLDSADLTEVLYEDLDWQDFEWVERGVVVQPRAKRNAARGHSASLMEGVELTEEDSDDLMQTKSSSGNATGVVNGGQDENQNSANAGADATTSVAVEGSTESQDAQQDGVFCVVSRLFWRPMTEQHARQEHGPSSLNGKVKAVKDAAIPPAVESQLRHGSQEPAPLSVASSAAQMPTLQAVETGFTADLRPSTQQPPLGVSTDTAGSNETAGSIPSSAEPPVSVAAPLASSTVNVRTLDSTDDSTGVMDVDNVQTAPTIASESKSFAQDRTRADHEEGELEEGEISSD
ncbi:hypothetical protein BGZ99_000741 [Dissophora globulifera]|uniref:Uncharacterized protein n=1 Tax=Dissophora globulifera TaxID=979702 RepID=A0A9P6R477_9FUNG|nr:hypothetical protein BGZ99_000741 [Dissophora globulifera]